MNVGKTTIRNNEFRNNAPVPDSHRIRTVGTDPLHRIQSGCINSCVWGYLNAQASECLDA